MTIHNLEGPIRVCYLLPQAFTGGPTLKNLPAMWETQVKSLSWKDPLEKGMAIHSSILKEFQGQRSLAGYSPWGCKESDRTKQLPAPQVFLGDFPGGSDGKVSAYQTGDPGSVPGLGRSSGEGNGTPLQYSCPENSMDRGAW